MTKLTLIVEHDGRTQTLTVPNAKNVVIDTQFKLDNIDILSDNKPTRSYEMEETIEFSVEFDACSVSHEDRTKYIIYDGRPENADT